MNTGAADETPETKDATEAPDPKEAMKAALARKQASQGHAGGTATGPKVSGGPHGQAAGRREFRRKSGG
ncbi:MAG: DUF5302 domain-containing protein [Propionibacteriaceae bacterium]|jgi:hypothetical protein|nr:DUF5302 domain-containing protein [Micropruina sp.]HBY22964.1 hypothetical protein [Propionibacteriaceae bacterium]